MTGGFRTISRDVMLSITQEDKERNIYVHPNFLARNIFWQRLKYIPHFLRKHATNFDSVLDFGGGSGAFLPTLAQLFKKVEVIDLDVSDANGIISKFGLTNVELKQQDINHYHSEVKYHSIIAADVLEHFKDLQEPAHFINKHLVNNGILFISLPTENIIYEFGRKIIGKIKPIDHYHTSKEVISFFKSQGYEIIAIRYAPVNFFPIPLFHIAALKKTSEV